MGKYAGHVPYFNESIGELALHQERLFHRANGATLKDLITELENDGFKPFAISSGEEPLSHILNESDVAEECVRVIDSSKLFKIFNSREMYLIYKYEDVKTRGPGSLSGSPLQMSHPGRYSA